MAYKTAIADDYRDLAEQVKQFACGYATHDTPIFTGTGDGTIGHTTTALKSGRIGTHPATLTETWVIECTDATAGAEAWSVTGSVTGALAGATTGVVYTSGQIDFKIAAGTVDFALNDQWQFTTTQGQLTADGEAWSLEVDEGWASDHAEQYVILCGPGSAGTDEIYVTMRTFADDVADYHNLLFYGSTGYIASPRQLINKSTSVCMPLWNSIIPYWLAVNGRRIVLSAKISTVYTSAYAGFILPYATPTQYPYPLLIAGSSYHSQVQWSDDRRYYRSIADPGSSSSISTGPGGYSSMYLLHPSGTWYNYANAYGSTGSVYATNRRCLWPTNKTGLAASFKDENDIKIRENLDGTRDLYPLILSSIANYPADNLWGELDGCYWVTGFGSFSAEDVITINGINYVGFQNVHRTEWCSYWAMRQQ